jgi:negative regulator of sigma-B (phosphoserine phosphatase)
MQPTRGAVMALAAFSAWESRMQWLAVGNVEGVVLRAQETARPRVEGLLARGGIVGHRLPRLLVSTVPLARDDVVVLATDGIDGAFAERLVPGESFGELAGHILARYGRESDDALVLVVRYVG